MLRITLIIDYDESAEDFDGIATPALEEIRWALNNSYSDGEDYSSPRGYLFSIADLDTSDEEDEEDESEEEEP